MSTTVRFHMRSSHFRGVEFFTDEPLDTLHAYSGGDDPEYLKFLCDTAERTEVVVRPGKDAVNNSSLSDLEKKRLITKLYLLADLVPIEDLETNADEFRSNALDLDYLQRLILRIISDAKFGFKYDIWWVNLYDSEFSIFAGEYLDEFRQIIEARVMKHRNDLVNFVSNKDYSYYKQNVEKIISLVEEKSGTSAGALKAWQTRRRGLLDKLRDAIQARDAKAVAKIKVQLQSGERAAQQVYGEQPKGV